MYDNLPSDEQIQIYEASICLQDTCRREVVHDDKTNAFVGYPTAGTICRPCAIFLCGGDVLVGRTGGEPIEQQDAQRALFYWAYNQLLGATPDECRGPCPTLTYREARLHMAAGPILMARQPAAVVEVVGSFRFVDGCTHQYDWNLKGCRCRYCNCCSQYWAAGSNDIEAGDEEGTPREDCPECVAWKAAGCPADPVVSEMEKVGAS